MSSETSTAAQRSEEYKYALGLADNRSFTNKDIETMDTEKLAEMSSHMMETTLADMTTKRNVDAVQLASCAIIMCDILHHRLLHIERQLKK